MKNIKITSIKKSLITLTLAGVMLVTTGCIKRDENGVPVRYPIGNEYNEGDAFCYIQAPWGEFITIPAALGGQLVEINVKQGQKVNKGEVIAYIQRNEEK